MSTNKTWGAVLRNYQPKISSTSYLEQYLQSEKIVSNSIDNKPVSGYEEYLKSIYRHFDRLNDFLENEDSSLVNLVFGNVQSGKTRHLLANICWARDNEFQLAIVFTGSNTDLGEQTVERMKSKLPNGTAHIIPSPTESRLATGPVLDQIQEYVYSRLSNNTKPIPVVTLIKSPARLSAVKTMIEELNRRINLRMRILILDDEADQASVDATANSKSQVLEDVSLIDNYKIRTTIHNRINEIRDLISGKHIYLAYTATPQALIHGDLYGPLQPEFCSVIPSGESYTSIGTIVRTNNTLIKLDNVDRKVTSDKNLETMESCFCQFLILSWMHSKYPNVFHGKALEELHFCDQNSIQFLIHPSGRNNDHEVYKENMDSCVRDFKKFMENESTKGAFIDDYFKPAYEEVFNNFSKTIQEYFQQDLILIDCWDYMYDLLNSTNKLKVKLVNYKQRKELSNQGVSEPLVPIKEEQWNIADAWVLIGGDILGRGLTLPHLVITLFLRNPKDPIFDTAVQQMRFCGYRKDYLKVLRVYADAEIVDYYEHAVNIDEPFRLRAARWDEDNRNLIQNPPVLRFIAPADSPFRPTRNSVLSGEIVIRDTTSSSGFFSLNKIADPKKFINNFNVIIDITRELSLFDRYQDGNANSKANSSVYSLNYNQIIDLYSKWQYGSGEDLEFRALVELMGYPASERGLADLSFLFSVDNPILDHISGEELHSDHEKIKGLPFRTLDTRIEKGDWKNFLNSSVLENAEAKAIVGGTERKMHKNYSDSVFIQCRLYSLLNPGVSTSSEENGQGEVCGLGLSLIGWIPDYDSEFYINREAGKINVS